MDNNEIICSMRQILNTFDAQMEKNATALCNDILQKAYDEIKQHTTKYATNRVMFIIFESIDNELSNCPVKFFSLLDPQDIQNMDNFYQSGLREINGQSRYTIKFVVDAFSDESVNFFVLKNDKLNTKLVVKIDLKEKPCT